MMKKSFDSKRKSVSISFNEFLVGSMQSSFRYEDSFLAIYHALFQECQLINFSKGNYKHRTLHKI